MDYQEYLASREWALKREAVRKRCKDWCERCGCDRMSSVHHRTYKNIGNEPLTDLQGVCEACHKFLSGKSDEDPVLTMGAGTSVYLAGRITNTDWRNKLLIRDLGSLVGNRGNTIYLPRGASWKTERSALLGGFDYVGPYFADIEGGHGNPLAPSTHGGNVDESHGEIFLTSEVQRQIAADCMAAISRAQVVFAWIPSLDPIPAGTLYELGIAARGNQLTVLAITPEVHESGELWLSTVFTRTFVAENAMDGWVAFLHEWPSVARHFQAA